MEADPDTHEHSAAYSRPPPNTSTIKVLRRPVESAQYTSWWFGSRLREAGLLGSMGKVATAYDNALMESFWGSMQIELLDRRTWETRDQLANAIFEWIEAWYNPHRRHSALGYESPISYEALYAAAQATA
jgi:putative transposase